MYIEDKLKEMKVRFDESGELSSSDKSFIQSHYERILSKRFNNSGCGQCYQDAFIEMYLHVKQYGIKDMGKFILKREEVLHVTGDSTVYTRVNITDEIAVKYLEQYPNAINRFEAFPDDWEELIQKENSTDSVEQIEAENQLIAKIVKMLNDNTSKTKIKEHFKAIDKVGEKNLTGVLVGEFIKKAEELIQKEAE